MPTSETPKVLHQGLLVPNAVGLTYPRMSEPDQIDFATAANAQWGVVDNCKVTISVFTVMVDVGIAIVNGKLVQCVGGSVTLASSGALDRFDSVIVNEGGYVEVLQGAYTVDPVFRDVPENATLLAVVFCPVGVPSFAGMVIDKRRFVSKALLTKINTTDPLIYNANDVGNHYSVKGDGYTEWEGDTCLYRSAPETLYVKKHLVASGDLHAVGNVTGKKLSAQEEVTGSNLILTEVPPPSASYPFGAIHQNSVNGDLSVNTATGWKQLAVADGIMPVGTVIQSVEPPSVMTPKGWVLLDGTTVSEVTWPRLFTLTAFNFSGEVGQRTLALPNMTDRVMRGSTHLGVQSGGHDSITLLAEQMPRHRHNVRTGNSGSGQITANTGRGGKHSHTVWGGVHTHPVIDPGHNHNGGEYPAGAFVCLVWGGQNKIDALFNDRNHTYSVESVQWTRPNTTGIEISSAASEHGHSVTDEGDHYHTYTLDVPNHEHSVGEDDVGQSLPIDITPSFLSTYFYIRG